MPTGDDEIDDDRIGLDQAYAVETPEDSRQLYAQWAETYDRDFIDATGYVYHENVVNAFLAGGVGTDLPVLDVGCGTGVVGTALAEHGPFVIDGIDISPEMLAVARTKTTSRGVPAYRRLIEADLTATLDIPAHSYGGIISVGTFTHGHLGPEPIAELCRVAAPGAVCALGINADHYAGLGFERWFEQRATGGRITAPHIVTVPIYTAMEGDHADTRSSVAVFRVLT